MRICTDWLKGFYRRLGETGIHSISMNETWTGVGVARDHFAEFMKPYEEECVQAAHDAGYLVSFHNCGRATLLLEDIADTGPDAIETLTSDPLVGRRRPRRRKATRSAIACASSAASTSTFCTRKTRTPSKAEVRRCLDAAMAGGGYVLRSTGQIFDAKPGLIEIMCETVREYGRYN